MEDELAGGVVQLQTVREYAEPADGDGAPVVCPFKGLASFDVADAPYFFGRERLVAELVARLVGAPLLGVVGPSGSGKSSVVRAGLLPALADGVLPGSEDWQQVLMRPGAHPAHELRRVDRRARRRPPDGASPSTSSRRRSPPAATRTSAAASSRSSSHLAQGGDGDVVVLAIRADFYGRCATYPELSRLLAANHVLVGAMRHVELRRAVVGARRAGRPARPARARRRARQRRRGRAGCAAAAVHRAARAVAAPRRRDLRLSSYEDDRRRPRRRGAARGGGVRRARPRPSSSSRAACSCGSPRSRPEGGVERRRLPLAELEAADGQGVGVDDRPARGRAAADRQRRQRRVRPRGAAARVAPAARLDRGRPRRPQGPPEPERCGATSGPAWAATTTRSTAARGWTRRASGPSAATRGRRRRARVPRRRQRAGASASAGGSTSASPAGPRARASITVVAIVARAPGARGRAPARHRGVARARGAGDELPGRRQRLSFSDLSQRGGRLHRGGASGGAVPATHAVTRKSNGTAMKVGTSIAATS